MKAKQKTTRTLRRLLPNVGSGNRTWFWGLPQRFESNLAHVTGLIFSSESVTVGHHNRSPATEKHPVIKMKANGTTTLKHSVEGGGVLSVSCSDLTLMEILTEAPCDGTVRRMEVIREEQRRLSAVTQPSEEPSRTNHIHLSSRGVRSSPAVGTQRCDKGEQFGLCSGLRGTVCPADC